MFIKQARTSLQCKHIDHYTLIVPNAKNVSDFHVNLLGFHFLRTQLVNTGTAPQGKFDMLNYVLAWPKDLNKVLVITEGLTATCVFNQYMQKFGQGIHHVAFQVSSMPESFAFLTQKGIRMTSDRIMDDPLTGLKQVFLDNKYTGVFIELIERNFQTFDSNADLSGFFTHDNMAGLANTMVNYLQESKLSESNTVVHEPVLIKNHCESNQGLVSVQPWRFSIKTQNALKSAEFFSQILNLQIETYCENSFLLKTPDPNSPTLKYGLTNEKTSYCELECVVDDLSQVSKMLDLENIDYKFRGDSIAISEKYSGYPLILSEHRISTPTINVPEKLQITIEKEIEELERFIGNPLYLPQWTAHRAIYYKEGQYFEIRERDGKLINALLNVNVYHSNPDETSISFIWNFPNEDSMEVIISLRKIALDRTNIQVSLPKKLMGTRLNNMCQVIQCELDILKAIHEENLDNISTEYWNILQLYHLSFYPSGQTSQIL